MAQPGSALVWGARGRWFESSPPDEENLHLYGEDFFMSHFVYILRSEKDGRYYIGETTNVAERLLFHNMGKQRSTKHRIPFVLVKYEEFSTRKEALARERQIKSWKGGNMFKDYLK